MQNDVLRGEDWNPEERATFIAPTMNKEECCSISRQPNDTSCEEDTGNFTNLRGTFHQGNSLFSESAGIQCTAMAAASIVMCTFKHPAKWTTHDVDSVLILGDEVYKKSIKARNEVHYQEVNPEYLNADELIRDITFKSKTRRIKIGNPFQGHLITDIGDGYLLNLEKRLDIFFENERFAVLTADGLSMALGKMSQKFWMFDSHSRD